MYPPHSNVLVYTLEWRNRLALAHIQCLVDDATVLENGLWRIDVLLE